MSFIKSNKIDFQKCVLLATINPTVKKGFIKEFSKAVPLRKGMIMASEFYNFSAKSLQGEEIKLDTYKNKVVLIVNTASECGFTPQLEGLQKLYEQYKEEGLVILGFPCNQFGSQEPGDEKSIAEGCVVNFGVNFPMFAKVDVNGENAHALFKFLKGELGGIMGSRIKWNFTKFLIDREGNPVKRYAPITRPQRLEKDIKTLVQKKVSL